MIISVNLSEGFQLELPRLEPPSCLQHGRSPLALDPGIQQTCFLEQILARSHLLGNLGGRIACCMGGRNLRTWSQRIWSLSCLFCQQRQILIFYPSFCSYHHCKSGSSHCKEKEIFSFLLCNHHHLLAFCSCCQELSSLYLFCLCPSHWYCRNHFRTSLDLG